MKVRNNYNECLTNLACSIASYFNASYSHNTIDYIDKLLNEKKPRNVVTILLDGMGSYIMDKHLNNDSFLMKNRLKSITSVFPATTVAATTSVMTGLNPCETGMLGWTMYFDEVDDTFVTFIGSRKTDTDYKPVLEAQEYIEKYLTHKSVVDRINEETNNHGYYVSPFSNIPYDNLDDMFNKIENICNNDGCNYIYAYNDEPDHTMHDLGTDDIKIKELIEERQNKIYELAKKLKDSVIFVIADHGHLNTENIMLKDYPDIIECLKRLPSIEQRAVNFFIKDDMKDKFEKLFNQYFCEDFDLYTKEDVISSQLFGDGIESVKFRSELGDYLAISHTKKTLLYTGDDILNSQHAGYSDDEIFIPLIVIDTNNVN